MNDKFGKFGADNFRHSQIKEPFSATTISGRLLPTDSYSSYSFWIYKDKYFCDMQHL